MKLDRVCAVPWYRVKPGEEGALMAALPAAGVTQLVAPPSFAAPGRLESMTRIAAAEGLAFTAAHGLIDGAYDLGVADAAALAAHRRYLERLAAVGIRSCVFHSGSHQFASAGELPADFAARFRRNLERLLELADGLPVVAAVENVYEPLPLLEEMIAAVAAAGAPSSRLGMCFDSGHANIHRAGLWAVFERMRPYVVTCHLHDNDGTADRHLPPEEGNIDWPRLAAALRQCPLIHLESEFHALPTAELWRRFGELTGGEC